MKKNIFVFLVIVSMLLTACQPSLTEAQVVKISAGAVQTAIAGIPTTEKSVEELVLEKTLVCESTPVPTAKPTLMPTEKVVPTPGWIGDDFGPEMALPDFIKGPAIAQLWNQTTSFCGLVKVGAGETLNWIHSGAFWVAGSQDALNARWTHHLAEYVSKNPSCKIYISVEDLPDPLP